MDFATQVKLMGRLQIARGTGRQGRAFLPGQVGERGQAAAADFGQEFRADPIAVREGSPIFAWIGGRQAQQKGSQHVQRLAF